MKNLINISIDSSLPDKTRENITSCLKDHKLNNCLNTNNIKLNDDIFITNNIENIVLEENFNVLLISEEHISENLMDKRQIASTIQISDDDIESLINFIKLTNDRKREMLVKETQILSAGPKCPVSFALSLLGEDSPIPVTKVLSARALPFGTCPATCMKPLDSPPLLAGGACEINSRGLADI